MGWHAEHHSKAISLSDCSCSLISTISVALQRSSSDDRNEQVLQDFNYLDAANPLAGLILDAENNLYGTTLDDLLGGKGHLSLDEDLVKLSKMGSTSGLRVRRIIPLSSGNSDNANAISDCEPRSLPCPNAGAKRPIQLIIP
jgi:hypothetical protein